MSQLEQSVRELVKLYTTSAKKMLSDIENVSDFTSYNRRKLLKQIDRELKKLSINADYWTKQEIKKFYKNGMQDAIDGLDILVAKGAIGKDAVGVGARFTEFNVKAVEQLVNNTSSSLIDSLNVVNRNVKQIVASADQRAVRAKIAEGVVSGQTKNEIAKLVKQELKDRGMTAMKDKAGRSWSMDRYADMVARTNLVQARNTGHVNKMLENGHDLVEVSINGSSHAECAKWEGRILSLTGKTPGYQTVDSADGLFHPNCKHVLNTVHPDFANETYGWNPFTGQYEQGVIDRSNNDVSLKTNSGGWIKVYQGKGGDAIMPQNVDMFGQAQYFAKDQKVARLYGRTKPFKIDDKKAKNVLTIGSQDEYQSFVNKVIKKYPTEDLQSAIPKYAKANKIDMAIVKESFDPDAGIAIFNSKLIK